MSEARLNRRKNYAPDACCIHEGCERKPKADGLCFMHYKRRETGKDLDDPIRRKYLEDETCIAPWCERKPKCNGFCRMHYDRDRLGRDLSLVPRRFEFPEILTLEIISRMTWTLGVHGYLTAIRSGRSFKQHRVIWEAYNGRKLKPFENIHHKNGIRDDNRIENLELWTKAQPCGQRPEDLVAWVLDNYRELVEARLALF